MITFSQAENQHHQPQRVVSLNLCTDILAVLIADPDQIISLSLVASDPVSSPVAEIAKNYPTNQAGVEEILKFKPDLVLASVYTSPEKITLLEKMGVRVERFGFAQSFVDIHRDMLQMGQALGQEKRALDMLEKMDQQLASLSRMTVPVRVVIYEPNGLTSGSGSLADALMQRLGIRNLATENRQLSNGVVSLEALLQLHPDLVIQPEFYQKPALAYENYSHPVMRKITNSSGQPVQFVSIPMRYWSCGSPLIVEAAKLLNTAIQQTQNPSADDSVVGNKGISDE